MEQHEIMNVKFIIVLLIFVSFLCVISLLSLDKWNKSAEWTIEQLPVDGKTLTVISTPIELSANQKIKVSGFVKINNNYTGDQNSIPDLPLTIDLFGGPGFDLTENDISIPYQRAKAGTAFDGIFKNTDKYQNLFLRIFHYYPEHQITGRFELYTKISVLRQLGTTLNIHRKKIFIVLLIIILVLFLLNIIWTKHTNNTFSSLFCSPNLQHENCLRIKEHPIWFFLATICLIWMCYLFFLYYHPFKIFINSDDAWNILEIKYHSIIRDGLVRWTTDREGAIFIIVAQFIADTLRLSNILPYAYIFLLLTAFVSFTGVVWIGRKSKTFFVFAPLLLMFFIKNQYSIDHNIQTLSFWAWRIGAIPIFMAMLTFVSLLSFSCKNKNWHIMLIITSLLALISFIQSPGNVVLFGVWFGLLFLRYVVLMRTQFIKWIVAAATFAFTYYLNTVIRTIYDHNIHFTRNSSPMNFNFAEFTNTFKLLLAKIRVSALDITIVYIGIGILMISLILFLLRRIKFSQKYLSFIDIKAYHAAFLLSFSGLIYFFLICSNRWVQLNSQFIINYAIPAILIFIVAAIWFVQPIILKIPGIFILIIGTFLIFLVTHQTMTFKPEKYSEQYNNAKLVLKYTDEDKSIDDFSLIGDFWTSLIYSWFDPVKLMASGIKDQDLTNITLPLALKRKTVLVNFNDSPENFAENQETDYLTQNNCLLAKTTDNHNLAVAGWHTYKNYSIDELIVGNDILSNKIFYTWGGAALSNNIFYMNKQKKDPAEIIWNVGFLPEGLYMMTLSARYKYKSPASGLLAMHLMDEIINPDYPMIAINPINTSSKYKLYKILLYYRGCDTPTKLRIYSLADKPFEIESVGLFPLKLKKINSKKDITNL